MNACGCSDMPLIAGAGGHSIVTARASLAAMTNAGASHALVLPSSYYPNQLGAPAAVEFYIAIADSSPIPILIYSYPGVCSGINLSSDVTRKLSQHPRIRGVKHTDHDIGKMARNCALPAAADDGAHFLVLGGASDYLVGALAVGAHGTSLAWEISHPEPSSSSNTSSIKAVVEKLPSFSTSSRSQSGSSVKVAYPCTRHLWSLSTDMAAFRAHLCSHRPRKLFSTQSMPSIVSCKSRRSSQNHRSSLPHCTLARRFAATRPDPPNIKDRHKQSKASLLTTVPASMHA